MEDISRSRFIKEVSRESQLLVTEVFCPAWIVLASSYFQVTFFAPSNTTPKTPSHVHQDNRSACAEPHPHLQIHTTSPPIHTYTHLSLARAHNMSAASEGVAQGKPSIARLTCNGNSESMLFLFPDFIHYHCLLRYKSYLKLVGER